MQDHSDMHSMVFNSLDEQIAVIDGTGTIIDVNHAWTQFGIENGLACEYTAVGGNYLEVLKTSAASGDSLAAEASQGILDVLSGKRASLYLEYPCHSPEQRRWFMMRISPLRGSSGALFVISHLNITERKLAEERSEYLALHDPLTGLANRRYFNETLSNETRRATRNQSAITLIELDIDHFKDYNDALGHLSGDECLVKVGRILLAHSRRPGDLAARFGGDEFALIFGDTDFLAAQAIADEIRTEIEALGLKYGASKQVTASMGVVSVIPQAHHTESLLIEEADRALYRAKMAGRNRIVHEIPGSNEKLAGTQG